MSSKNIKNVKDCPEIWIILEICYSLSLSHTHSLTANLDIKLSRAAACIFKAFL